MTGYIQKDFGCRTKRYVQTLELRDDPDLIREYRKWHSEEHHWKEIRDGIKEVGILEMELYILGTRLVMIVDDEPARHPAPPGGVGSLRGSFPGMQCRSTKRREMADDGTHVPPILNIGK